MGFERHLGLDVLPLRFIRARRPIPLAAPKSQAGRVAERVLHRRVVRELPHILMGHHREDVKASAKADNVGKGRGGKFVELIDNQAPAAGAAPGHELRIAQFVLGRKVGDDEVTNSYRVALGEPHAQIDHNQLAAIEQVQQRQARLRVGNEEGGHGLGQKVPQPALGRGHLHALVARVPGFIVVPKPLQVGPAGFLHHLIAEVLIKKQQHHIAQGRLRQGKDGLHRPVKVIADQSHELRVVAAQVAKHLDEVV